MNNQTKILAAGAGLAGAAAAAALWRRRHRYSFCGKSVLTTQANLALMTNAVAPRVVSRISALANRWILPRAAQRRAYAGRCLPKWCAQILSPGGGGSLSSHQYLMTCSTIFENFENSMGFRT